MKKVIILAAGTIKKKIHFLKYTFDCPALIPVGTKPLGKRVAEYYIENLPNSKIFIVVNEEFKTIVKNYLSEIDSQINVLSVTNSTSVLNTLEKVREKFDSNDDIIINLVTTIPTELIKPNSFQIDRDLSLSNEWSVVIKNDNTISFHSKMASNPQKGHALTGIFRSKAKIIFDAIKDLEKEEFTDLINIVKSIYEKDQFKEQKTTWIDCGHEMNYFKAKTLLISSRTFNKIQINPVKGILNKKSSHVKTQFEETHFIQNLPENLKIYFPRILKGPIDHGASSEVEMEYYGYPSLAEYMLFWELNPGLWKNIFNALQSVLVEFEYFRCDVNIKEYKQFYWGKTNQRLKEFQQQLGPNKNIFKSTLLINGKKYKNINLLNGMIIEKLSKLYERSRFTIMHGDLCFNNIVYDIYSGTIRLFDARGSFGSEMVGIYGDQNYDIAKISHSVIGKYDYIVNGMFSYNESDNSFNYKIFENQTYNIILDANKELLKHFNLSMEDIYFLIGLLFVSMTPLHAENLIRQKILYLHGIIFLNKSMEN